MRAVEVTRTTLASVLVVVATIPLIELCGVYRVALSVAVSTRGCNQDALSFCRSE